MTLALPPLSPDGPKPRSRVGPVCAFGQRSLVPFWPKEDARTTGTPPGGRTHAAGGADARAGLSIPLAPDRPRPAPRRPVVQMAHPSLLAVVFCPAKALDPRRDNSVSVRLDQSCQPPELPIGNPRVVVAKEHLTRTRYPELCCVHLRPTHGDVNVHRLQRAALVGPEVGDVGTDPKKLWRSESPRPSRSRG